MANKEYYEDAKAQLEYWMRPWDQYEIPPTLKQWRKKDNNFHEFAISKEIEPFSNDDNAPDGVSKSIIAFDELAEDLTFSLNRDGINEIKEHIAKSRVKLSELEKKLDAIATLCDEEQNKYLVDYKGWLACMVNRVVRSSDYTDNNPLEFVDIKNAATINDLHVAQRIRMRNTAAYLFCYDNTGLVDRFLVSQDLRYGSYLALLAHYMNKNKQSIIDDTSAPIHRMRISKDGRHAELLFKDIAGIRYILNEEDNEEKPLKKKRKMDEDEDEEEDEDEDEDEDEEEDE